MQLVCAKPVAKKLFDESVSILDTISTKSNEKEYQKKLDEIFTKFKKDFDSTKKTVKDEVIKKYGSLKNIPASEKKSLQEDAKVEVMLLAQPMIDDIFEVLDLKSSNSSEVKKVLSKYAMDQNRLKYTYRNNSRLLVLVVEEVLKENLPDITLQCIAEHTDFHNIDDINVIELRQKSPDKAKVRLEIIYENTKSKKVSIKVEKIKDQWKVTRGSSIKGIY